MNAFYESLMQRLDAIKGIANFTDKEMEVLLNFKRISKAELDVDGKKYPAYRILHNEALGPGKGGIRFHPDVVEEEVKSLALVMSLKNSLAGLPYGGGKGGVAIDTKGMDLKLVEKVSRAYAAAFADVIGQDKDIPAPDVYTNPQIMGWMLDEYEKKVGHHEPGVITGKPLALGGIAQRADATAKGGLYMVQAMIKQLGWSSTGLKVAVQGFGNAGSFIAKMLHEAGHKVVAVTDSKGGVMDQNGLDIPALAAKKEQGTALSESGFGTQIDIHDRIRPQLDCYDEHAGIHLRAAGHLKGRLCSLRGVLPAADSDPVSSRPARSLPGTLFNLGKGLAGQGFNGGVLGFAGKIIRQVAQYSFFISKRYPRDFYGNFHTTATK